MKKIRKFIPIILFILFLAILEIIFWNNTNECGLGFGVITHGSLFPLCTFVISLGYSLTTKNKYKYFLIPFFALTIMIFEWTTYDLLSTNSKLSLSVIPMGLIYGAVSLIGILLGNLRKEKKRTGE